jgi:hypothetical protein
MRLRVALTSCLVVACTAQRHTELPPKRTAVAAAPSTSTSASIGGAASVPKGSRAKYVPLVSDSWQASDTMVVDNGTLYVGSAGQRWLVRAEKAPLPDDPDHERYVLTGAGSMAPEALLYVRKRGNGFVFVGETGSVYSAKGPLEDFTAVRSPPEPLRSVAMGRDALVGITRRDALLRSSDDGASFANVKGPPSPLTIVANPKGELLMYSAPGRVVASVDDGLSFKPTDTLGIGPLTFLRAADGTLSVRGTAISATKPPGLAGFSTAYASLRSGVLERVKFAPSSVSRPTNDDEQLDYGEGAATGRALYNDNLYLEVHTSDTGLVVATLADGKVSNKPLNGSKDCELVAVAGSGTHVVIECVRVVEGPKGTRDDLLFFRSGDGGKTFASDGAAVGGEAVRTLAISPKGTLYATGIGEGVAVRPVGQKTFTAAKWPKDYVPQKVLVVADDRAYVVANGPGDTGAALLVSRDGGKTFTAKPAPIEHLDDTTQLAFDNGTFAAFALGDPVTRHATRDDGATWDTKELPIGAEWLSMAGPRGLATNNAGKGYETLDFGVTWGVVALPRWSAVGGTMPIACAPQSCLLGDVAIRKGWELVTAADITPPVPTVKAAREHVHLPLMECTPDGDETELGTTSEPELEPNATLLWSALSESANGAIDLVTWPRNAKAIARIPLLPAPKEPAGVRKWTSDDGVIILRAARGDGKVMADLELAWWVASTNKVHTAKIPHGTTSLGKWGTPSAVAAIAPGYGLYVRTANTNEPALYLARENGPTAKVTLKDPFPSFTRLFARRTAKGTVFAALTRDAAAVDPTAILAELSDAGTLTTHAWGLWMGQPPVLATFSGDFLTVRANGNERVSSRALVFPWKDAPMETPDATSVPKDIATCAATTGARLEMPWVLGGRTPITIKRAKGTINHATLVTVTRNNCARGILAGTTTSTPGQEWTMIPADDPTHAFGILRAPSKGHALARLNCQKSAAPLPNPFHNIQGFVVPN